MRTLLVFAKMWFQLVVANVWVGQMARLSPAQIFVGQIGNWEIQQQALEVLTRSRHALKTGILYHSDS